MSPMTPEIKAQLNVVADEAEDILKVVYDGVQLPADIMKGVAEGLEANEEYQKLIAMVAPEQTKELFIHIIARIPQFALNALMPIDAAVTPPE